MEGCGEQDVSHETLLSWLVEKKLQKGKLRRIAESGAELLKSVGQRISPG
jgi:hypothetical protein